MGIEGYRAWFGTSMIFADRLLTAIDLDTMIGNQGQQVCRLLFFTLFGKGFHERVIIHFRCRVGCARPQARPISPSDKAGPSSDDRRMALTRWGRRHDSVFLIARSRLSRH